MANRILRDWTDSDKINSLSIGAERFFTRLIMKVDDYGVFYADTRLLKANLFPMLLDSIREAEITRWIAECEKAGIVVLYEHSGKRYIQIVDFKQRLDRARSKYPLPSANEARVIANDSRAETETKQETESETESETMVWPTFDDFWDKYSKKVDRPKCEKLWKKIQQGAREKIMEHLEMYVRSTPDVQYRKDPATYLRNQSWENQIIEKTDAKHPRITTDQRDQFIRAKYGVKGITA